MKITIERLLQALTDSQEIDLDLLLPPETAEHLHLAGVKPFLEALPPHHRCEVVREELVHAAVAGILVGISLYQREVRAA